MKAFLLMMSAGLLFSIQVNAADSLSVTPEETWILLQKQSDQMLFVDVRDPVEIFFVGFTDAVDTNVPFRLVDRSRFNAKTGKFAMDINPNFADEIDAALKAKGLSRNALIVTMCRSGSHRGKPSAEYLLGRGFTNVKYIDHGFQGDSAQEGEMKGRRVVNGWQNAGLPWSKKVNPDKIYRQ